MFRRVLAMQTALLMILAALSLSQGLQRLASPAVERTIDSLLSRMTIGEKVGQLNQITVQRGGAMHEITLTDSLTALIAGGHVGSFLNVVGAGDTRKFQRYAVEHSRLHIPLLFGLDVIHGFRTCFPIPLAEASSWDPDLVTQEARVAAAEASASGINWTFAPMVDIARDPRWGRIAEGAGEDPYLGSVMATARVRGFQGASLRDPASLVACAKHFAAYGAAEGGRDYNTVDISERTLRDIYLPPFRAAVDAGAGSLMSSFNEISGIPSTANPFLLTTILRKEWSFKGFVVSDWGSIEELINHGIAGDGREAARKAITAGVDMDMVSGLYAKYLPALVGEGSVPEAVLDEAVRRILRVKYALGLFDDPYRDASPDRESHVLLAPGHRRTARELADESIVLLKNAGDLLPLSKSVRTLAVIGPLANNSSAPLGPWHALGRDEEVVTVLAGIRNAAGSGAKILFAPGCDSAFADTSGFAEAERIAREADAAVVVVGEQADMSGEAASRSDIGLPGVQEELVRRIQGTGRPVVVVLMNGRPLTFPWISEHVPAILEDWFGGTEAGNAVADVLFGDVNPSGKLPVTFPRSVGQIPIYYDHKNTGRPFSATDKFTSKYVDSPNTPMYPFGYGLSYTRFAYSHLRAASLRVKVNGTLRVSVDLKNSGNRVGTEVTQVYVRDLVASVTRPVRELKAFRRTTLAPGEQRTLEFVIGADQLGFTGGSMKYVVEPGRYRLYVGGSSVETLEGSFELVEQ